MLAVRSWIASSTKRKDATLSSWRSLVTKASSNGKKKPVSRSMLPPTTRLPSNSTSNVPVGQKKQPFWKKRVLREAELARFNTNLSKMVAQMKEVVNKTKEAKQNDEELAPMQNTATATKSPMRSSAAAKSPARDDQSAQQQLSDQSYSPSRHFVKNKRRKRRIMDFSIEMDSDTEKAVDRQTRGRYRKAPSTDMLYKADKARHQAKKTTSEASPSPEAVARMNMLESEAQDLEQLLKKQSEEQQKAEASYGGYSTFTSTLEAPPASSTPQPSIEKVKKLKIKLKRKAVLTVRQRQTRMARAKVKHMIHRLKTRPKWRRAFLDQIKAQQLIREVRYLHREMKKMGAAMLPRRPPSETVLEYQDLQHSIYLQRLQEGAPGTLPRDIRDHRNTKAFPPAAIQLFSLRFKFRRTSWHLLMILLTIVALYEALLSFDEWYYSSRPEALRQHLEQALQTDGQFFKFSRMYASEEATIKERSHLRFFGYIPYYLVPNFVWHWLVRAEKNNLDPLIQLLQLLYFNIHNTVTVSNLRFFANYSRLWDIHKEHVDIGSLLLKSLKENRILPPTIDSYFRHPIRRYLDSDRTAIALLKAGALTELIGSRNSDDDFSLESLIIRSTLANSQRIAAFWELPSSVIQNTLETLVLYTETKPRIVAFILASITKDLDTLSLNLRQQRLLVSVTSMLRDKEKRYNYVAEMGEMAADNLLRASVLAENGETEARKLDEELKLDKKKRKENWAIPSYDFEPEQVRRGDHPSYLYVGTVGTLMTWYIWRRYRSMALWNGMGAIPIPTRRTILRMATIAPLLSSFMWFWLDSAAPRINGFAEEYVRNSELQQNLRSPAPASATTTTKPSSYVSASLGVALPLWALKLGVLWRHPFILGPQVIAYALERPFAWIQKYRHQRMQSKPAKL